MRSGIKLLDDLPGTGPLVERQRTYLMRLKMWLNNGEPVRWNQPWGLMDENLINGLFYGIDGMRVGGTRRLKVSPHMGYGSQGVPGIIPENAVLVVEVNILEEREEI